MILYSDKLDRPALDALAADVGGMVLADVDERGTRTRGKFAGKTCTKFVLRPGGIDPDKHRLIRDNPYGKSGIRRVHAISWEGHRIFMDRLFDLDPDAVLKTAMATYDGREGFDREHPRTGDRNIGSMIHPLSYRDADAVGMGIA